ncbi:hypothetical protein ACFLV4_02960 [Chloroflexota bacterium]
MKPGGVLSSLSDLFNPVEIRRAKQIKKQWDELDDVASIVFDRNSNTEVQEGEEEQRDELRDEMNMLLDRIDSDINHVRDIVNRLQIS